MEDSLPPATSDRITSDIPCARCGYNLRSLPAAGRCTECGLSIRTSLAVPSPEWANYEWVSRVRLGTILLLAGQLMLAGGMIASAFQEDFSRWIFVAALAIDGAGAALLVWPARGLESDRRLAALRVGALFTCPMPMIAVALPRLYPLLAGWPICVFCCFAYLQRLAARAGWKESADRAWKVSLGLPVGMAIFSPVAFGYLNVNPSRPFEISGSNLFGYGLVVFVGWIIAVHSLADLIRRLERHRRGLEEQDQLAGKN